MLRSTFTQLLKPTIVTRATSTSTSTTVTYSPRSITTSSHRMASQNQQGQGVSHASDSSVPESVQRQAPKKLEDELPDSVHDTGSNQKTGKVSHATGDSKVPQALQEALPESVERAVPDAIHDTSGLEKK